MATFQWCHLLLAKSPEIHGDFTDLLINYFESRPKCGDIQSRRQRDMAPLPEVILKSPISDIFFKIFFSFKNKPYT